MPRYTVQTPDGEMEYGSLEQLRQAVEMGLVRPTDMVNEEGFASARPAGRVAERKGAAVKSARRNVPIPSPVPSSVLIALALLALLYEELPRLTVMFPDLGNVPGVSWLMSPPSWLPDSIPSVPGLTWPQLAAVALMLAVLVRALFAAAPQNALFFLLAGAYFARTDRVDLAIPCGAAAAAVIALGVRRLARRRAAARG